MPRLAPVGQVQRRRAYRLCMGFFQLEGPSGFVRRPCARISTLMCGEITCTSEDLGEVVIESNPYTMTQHVHGSKL